MEKSSIWTIVIVVILVVLGIILLSLPKDKAPEGAVPEGEEVVAPEAADEAAAETAAEIAKVLEEAAAVVPEGSLVTEAGDVLTPTGATVNNEALPGSPTAPKQSRAISEAEIPDEAIKLTVTADGFSPNEFTVKAGSAVTFSVTSGDRTHVFKFDDPGLQGVAIGVAGNETRAITFKAPGPGSYTFFCDVPGHRGRGETGVMHVE